MTERQEEFNIHDYVEGLPAEEPQPPEEAAAVGTPEELLAALRTAGANEIEIPSLRPPAQADVVTWEVEVDEAREDAVVAPPRKPTAIEKAQERVRIVVSPVKSVDGESALVMAIKRVLSVVLRQGEEREKDWSGELAEHKERIVKLERNLASVSAAKRNILNMYQEIVPALRQAVSLYDGNISVRDGCVFATITPQVFSPGLGRMVELVPHEVSIEIDPIAKEPITIRVLNPGQPFSEKHLHPHVWDTGKVCWGVDLGKELRENVQWYDIGRMLTIAWQLLHSYANRDRLRALQEEIDEEVDGAVDENMDEDDCSNCDRYGSRFCMSECEDNPEPGCSSCSDAGELCWDCRWNFEDPQHWPCLDNSCEHAFEDYPQSTCQTHLHCAQFDLALDILGETRDDPDREEPEEE